MTSVGEVLQNIQVEAIKSRLSHYLNSGPSEDIIDVLFTPWDKRGYYYGIVRSHRGSMLQVFKPDGATHAIRTYAGGQLKRHQIVKVVYFEGECVVKGLPTIYDFQRDGYL